MSEESQILEELPGLPYSGPYQQLTEHQKQCPVCTAAMESGQRSGAVYTGRFCPVGQIFSESLVLAIDYQKTTAVWN
jgi:hypothetical protein